MLTVLIIYMLIMLAIGIWAGRYNKDMTDFLLAGRRLGLLLATFTLTATYFGGGYFMGCPAMPMSTAGSPFGRPSEEALA